MARIGGSWRFPATFPARNATFAVVMVRKRRTEVPTAGEGSGSEESSGSVGQGGGSQRPVGRAPMPQQQGGGGGRGWAPQQLQYVGRGGGYYQGRGAGPQLHGGMAPQQVSAPHPEFQGRGGAPQPCGGMMSQLAHQDYPGRGGAPPPRGGGMAPQQPVSQYEYRGRGGPQEAECLHNNMVVGEGVADKWQVGTWPALLVVRPGCQLPSCTKQ